MRKSIGIALLLLTPLLRAQAPTSFRDGVLAFEKKEWKNAEKFMREAIAGNAKESEGTVSIAGSWFETYVPHYFLARALARQGKCDEALKEFAESERQGVTPAIPDFAKHLQTRGGCKPQAKTAKPREIVFETTVPFGGDAPAAAPAPVVVPPTVVAPDYTATRQQLRAAVNSYLHGRYDEAVRVLTKTKFDDRAAAAEAALLRAAARHALYRIGGETDTAARKQIAEDLMLYRSLRPNGRPDPRLFPPGFIALTR
jgi:tetratricopeptide (TPR) repeat protein